ncbi:TonB-dependent receptor [Muricauda sp. 2012CJ35-5]|uniref:TonB-dependent receptor n=1 Tax=Flagellimonas spongiicola TaxID=2942208 RepID=A0ABT0PTK3_9FLAO|nr:TonB-dependent receptor [Allomuricauda spongiicola]MCL6274027.1 TonB-dependent receptor [Allomuricauda spongiicola]
MKGIFKTLIFLFAITCFAQQTPADSITQLDEVILLEDNLPKRAVGITASSTLGPTTFEMFNPIDIASAINQVSGVYILSGALNTNRITIRGVGARTLFGTDKLRLYFNGIPVTNGAGTSTIEAYDFENLGSMEVIKGPKGTAFGANLGGAILLDTKTAFPDETRLSNSFTVGSYSMIKDNLSFQHADENMQLSFSYNHFESDGYRQNNRFERDGFLLTSAINVGSKGELGLLLNYIDYNAQIPSSINQSDFDEDPTRAAGNWLAAQGFEDNQYTLLGVSYTHRFSENSKNTTSIFYTYLDHYEPRPFNILDEFTNGFGIRSQFDGQLGKGSFTLGTELYKDEYHWGTFDNLFGENNGNGSLQGDRLSRNLEFRTQLNLFGAYSYPLTNKLSAQVGLGLNNTSFDYRDLFNSGDANSSAERDFEAILLPNFGLQYQFRDGNLYANVSRGFSNPSLEQTLTPDGLINPDIAQEKGTNLELGGAFTLFEKRLSLDFALYRMTINDLLVEERVGEDQFIGRNAGETRHQGLELDLKYALKLSQHLILSPYLSYTFNDHSFIDFVDEGEDFSGNPLTGVPKHRISSGLDLRHTNGLRLNLTHQFVDAIPLRDDNSLQSDSFNVLHAKASYQTQLSAHINLGVNAGINNLFDTNYAQSVLINASSFGGAPPRYFYPGNGRNYYGGVQLGYVF